jgi:DNA-binding transcriptional LysR family regulator
MNDRLSALKLFVRVARTGSFSRAAKELGLSQPSASRLIASLERQVGVALLARSTRTVAPTEAGTDYLARIEPALAVLEEANQALNGKGALRGLLRIGLPANVAIREVIPRLPGFMARHPQLRVDLCMDDGKQDLIRNAIDVAIRFGRLEDSNATFKRVGTNQRLIAGAPAYLKRAGRPKAPSELQNHPVMIGPPGSNGVCVFKKEGKSQSVRVTSPLSANINEAAVAAAVAGIGIVSCSLWGCRAELKSGTLVQILTEWEMDAVEVYALFPAGRATKLAARAFADYFAKDLKLHG